MGRRSDGKPFAARIVPAALALAMAAVALPGCTVVADDRQESGSGSDGIEHLSDAATDAIIGGFRPGGGGVALRRAGLSFGAFEERRRDGLVRRRR